MNEEIEGRVAEEKADAQAAEERYNKKAQAAEEQRDFYESSVADYDKLSEVAKKSKAEYEQKKAEYEAKAADVKAAVIAEVKEEHEERMDWLKEQLCVYGRSTWWLINIGSTEEEKQAASLLPCCQQKQKQRALAVQVEEEQQRKKRKYGVYKLT